MKKKRPQKKRHPLLKLMRYLTKRQPKSPKKLRKAIRRQKRTLVKQSSTLTNKRALSKMQASYRLELILLRKRTSVYVRRYTEC